MEIEMIMEMVMQQGVWCALFVYLFISSQKKSDEREKQLMTLINSQGDKLERIAITLDKLNDDVEDLKTK